MFSFGSFGVPIVFAAVLLIAMTIGVTCIWDMWTRGDQIASYHPDTDSERPKLCDLFIEDPVGSRYADTVWGSLLPFAVTRSATTEQGTMIPAKIDIMTRPTILQRIRRKQASWDEFGGAYHHLQIAVAIALPSAPCSSCMGEIDREALTYCIGLHETTVAGLDLTI
ncbi:hypothetical protein DFH07DRAFT_844701 [Mycena maculata]|uniref:Uncharacterized protein n=1 Tax=Mycena maculata TaxID=230809 RepID=A0AAD7MVW1_9AGAR|nr:hypothetical protein DFH07DRAFT_844701 [Mycena maculata]